jgi:hypothetical protein
LTTLCPLVARQHRVDADTLVWLMDRATSPRSNRLRSDSLGTRSAEAGSLWHGQFRRST